MQGRLKIGVGAKDSDEMLRAMRVHSNFAEYAPITLLLIGFVEVQGAHPGVVHGLGALLLVGRCVHAHGMSQMNEKFVFRVTGMTMTFVALVAASGLLIFNFMTR